MPKYTRAYRKQKGIMLEKLVVELFQDIGIAAERIRDQPNRPSEEGGDVSVPLCGVDHKIECKNHKVGFEPVYRALAKADAAVVKGDRKEPLIVFPLKRLLHLIDQYEKSTRFKIETARMMSDAGIKVIEFKDAAE